MIDNGKQNVYNPRCIIDKSDKVNGYDYHNNESNILGFM